MIVKNLATPCNRQSILHINKLAATDTCVFSNSGDAHTCIVGYVVGMELKGVGSFSQMCWARSGLYYEQSLRVRGRMARISFGCVLGVEWRAFDPLVEFPTFPCMAM